MTDCVICGQPAVAFGHVYVSRKKRTSGPLCISHALMAYAFSQFVQDWGRSGAAKAFGIKKGTLPRLKVSLKP